MLNVHVNVLDVDGDRSINGLELARAAELLIDEKKKTHQLKLFSVILVVLVILLAIANFLSTIGQQCSARQSIRTF